MTKGEMAKLLAVLAASYPRFEVDDLKIQVWYEMLGDIGYDVASLAVKKLILLNTFPPAISEVRKAAIEMTSPGLLTGAEAWGEVMRAIRRYSFYEQKEAISSMSPETAKVVRYIGWREICLSEEGSGVLRGQFLKMYNQVTTREQEKQLLPPAMQEKIKQLAKNFDFRLIEGERGKVR